MWIVIPNWDRFQHYGDRQPPWIKLYNALLYDDDYQGLTPAERSALIGIWMLYATTRRRVRRDTANISRATGQRITNQTLESLNHAGFIGFSASKPLAPSIEVEVEVEKKKPLHVKSEERDDLAQSLKQALPNVCPTCGVTLRGTLRLAEHQYYQHGACEPAHWLEAEAKTHS